MLSRGALLSEFYGMLISSRHFLQDVRYGFASYVRSFAWQNYLEIEGDEMFDEDFDARPYDEVHLPSINSRDEEESTGPDEAAEVINAPGDDVAVVILAPEEKVTYKGEDTNDTML